MRRIQIRPLLRRLIFTVIGGTIFHSRYRVLDAAILVLVLVLSVTESAGRGGGRGAGPVYGHRVAAAQRRVPLAAAGAARVVEAAIISRIKRGEVARLLVLVVRTVNEFLVCRRLFFGQHNTLQSLVGRIDSVQECGADVGRRLRQNSVRVVRRWRFTLDFRGHIFRPYQATGLVAREVGTARFVLDNRHDVFDDFGDGLTASVVHGHA